MCHFISAQSPLVNSSASVCCGEQVVAMYDYQAQRSDELSMKRGDVVTVLYRDNDNWWMGENAEGKQGFFPANYVAGSE